MEEQSQRCDDAWSVEEIDSSTDLDEVRSPMDVDKRPEQFENVVHCFLRWMEIYGVGAFIEKLDEDEKATKDAGEVIDLSRSVSQDDRVTCNLRKIRENDRSSDMKSQ